MASLIAVALPVTISTTAIALDLTADATVGAAAATLRHTTAAGTTTVIVRDSHPEVHNGALGMWELECYDLAKTEFTVGPEDATDFAIYGPHAPFGGINEQFYTLEWHGATASNGAKFWVRILVGVLDTTSTTDKIEWYGWFGRENQTYLSVKTFRYPHLVVRGFSSPRGGETNFQAQGRTRFLAPFATHATTPYIVSNYPMNALSVHANRRRMFGENPLIFKMPWLVLCSGNDAQPAEFRTNVALRMSRTAGYNWDTTFQFLADDVDNPTVCYMEMAVSPIVSMIKDHGDYTEAADGLAVEAYAANDFGPKHVVYLEAFKSLTDEFYHDICERHREDYYARRNPTSLRNSTTLAESSKRYRQFVAMWMYSFDDTQERIAMENYYDFCRIVKGNINENFVSMRDSIAHQQSYHHRYSTGVVGEVASLFTDEYQYDPVYYTNQKDVGDRIAALGFRLSAYNNIRPFSYWPFQWVWPIRDHSRPLERLNNIGGTGYDVTDSRMFDSWWQNHGVNFIGDLNLGGMLLDTYTGGIRLTWHPPGEFSRDHIDGGGRWHADKRATNVPVLRELCAKASPARHRTVANEDPNFVIISETTEEWSDGNVDAAGPGYFFMPGHFGFGYFEDTLAVDAVGDPFFHPDSIKTDYPRGFRQSQPWLFKTCHHEWWNTFHFPADLMTGPLATEITLWNGLTDIEWVDFVCANRALIQVQGGQSFMHTIYCDGPDATIPTYLPTHRVLENGTLAIRDLTVDPNSKGDVIWAYMQELWDLGAPAYEQWVIDGKVERDLTVDLVNTTFVNNPIAPVRRYEFLPLPGDTRFSFPLGPKPNAYANWPFYHEIQAQFRVGNNDFLFPCVVHRAYQERGTNIVGLVISNWSQNAVDWWATFDPALYGISGSYDVNLVNKNGSRVSLATGLTGRADFQMSATIGGDINMGQIGPHTVLVFEIG